MEMENIMTSTTTTTSYDSIIHDEEAPIARIRKKNEDRNSMQMIRATLSSEEYDATTIRTEFQSYHSLLPKPDELLQKQHSVDMLRDIIIEYNNNNTQQQQQKKKMIMMPRFLKPEEEGGIAPHNALCCLLLDDFSKVNNSTTAEAKRSSCCDVNIIFSWLVHVFSLGYLYRQLILPAEFIRDQFYRIAHVIVPTEMIGPDVLRHKIRNNGLPVPNFFLDPEDEKQFPPHIAMIVILQEDQIESKYLQNYVNRLLWLIFATVALLLRIILEVIGGAGAIWGGSEVFNFRHNESNELWRCISIIVGILCFLRFVTLNAPQMKDEGDILGPAGPWSLHTSARLRAVCEHPFHYFARAQPPYIPPSNHRRDDEEEKNI